MLMFRQHFVISTEHLKDKFRIVLGRWLRKRSERMFNEMKDLIMNFDQNGITPKQFEKTDIKKGKVNTDIKNLNLDIVFEEDTTEDLEESKMGHFPDMQLPMNKIEEENTSSEQKESSPKSQVSVEDLPKPQIERPKVAKP